MLIFELS